MSCSDIASSIPAVERTSDPWGMEKQRSGKKLLKALLKQESWRQKKKKCGLSHCGVSLFLILSNCKGQSMRAEKHLKTIVTNTTPHATSGAEDHKVKGVEWVKWCPWAQVLVLQFCVALSCQVNNKIKARSHTHTYDIRAVNSRFSFHSIHLLQQSCYEVLYPVRLLQYLTWQLMKV